MYKVGVIIFSRFSSKRLPGKALIEINGKPLLSYVIEQSKKITPCDEIVVATSENKDDDSIASYGKNQSIKVWRGSLNNVLERCLLCSKFYKFDYIVRICGDRVFVDYLFINKLLEKLKSTKFDIYTNFCYENPPSKGAMAEIISKNALEVIVKNGPNKLEREHMTSYIYKNPEKFNIYYEKPNFSNKDINFSIDTYSDLKKAEKILKLIHKNKEELTINNIIRNIDLMDKT